MRTRTPALLFLGCCALSIFVIAVWCLGTAEVIRVKALEVVPLFDPESLAGRIGDSPKQIGLLKMGDELPVLACVDRKSDINVYATYEDKVVAVGEWMAKVQLIRADAHLWQQGAITSCRGFFESISTHS
jgi:hypothetical protein